MQFNDFLKAVQGYSGIQDMYEADKITQAALQTLSERLTAEEARHISSQLPFELKNYLRYDDGESFSVDEFYRRFARRADVDIETGKKYCKAVLMVLDQAITSGEIKHIKAQLPDEFIEIFP